MVLAVPGTASAGSSCEVGQPSEHEPASDDPVGNPLVIGCGEALGAPVEIAAYRTEDPDWLCVQIFSPAIEVSPFASCPHGRPEDGQVIDLTSAGVLHPGNVTDAVGDVRHNIAKVRVSFRGGGDPESGQTVLARVGPALAAKLGEPAAFGYFVSLVRGCDFAKVKSTALNRRGRVLGTSNGGTPGCL
jgi:hypothetical protein